MRSRRIRIILGVAAVVVVVVGALAFVGWYQLFREVPQRITSEQQRFAYGSIGNESGEGLPFEVWRVLPELFPEYLPDGGRGGYASLGFTQEPGRDVPGGVSKRTIGFPRGGVNCAAW